MLVFAHRSRTNYYLPANYRPAQFNGVQNTLVKKATLSTPFPIDFLDYSLSARIQ